MLQNIPQLSLEISLARVSTISQVIIKATPMAMEIDTLNNQLSRFYFYFYFLGGVGG